MPVLIRRRATRILIVAAAASVPLMLAAGAAVISVLIGQSCSGGGGPDDAPSQVAQRDSPASFLQIYEQVGAQYKIPWEILAGIGKEECDHGRTPDASCTPLPGATGPGVTNCAGASGPMQIGVGGGPCGSAGDEYDSLRRYLQNPALGPHDSTTAVELAALVLIKDKGAPTGRTIDAYWPYARAYNGSGPAAAAYADRVLADAHAYQGAGTLILAGCIADPGGYINPFAGEAWAPSRNDQGVDYDPVRSPRGEQFEVIERAGPVELQRAPADPGRGARGAVGDRGRGAVRVYTHRRRHRAGAGLRRGVLRARPCYLSELRLEVGGDATVTVWFERDGTVTGFALVDQGGRSPCRWPQASRARAAKERRHCDPVDRKLRLCAGRCSETWPRGSRLASGPTCPRQSADR